MISKISKGGGFRGLLNYNFDEKKSHEIIDSNMTGETPKELANEFSFSRKLNSRLSNPVFHVSLSFPENEKLENEKLKKVSNDYLKKMGFSNTQFVVIKHNDTKHQHVHIVASRIGFDGKTISDKNDVYRSIQTTRELEREHQLTEVESTKTDKSKHYSKKEADFRNRTGLKFTKENIKTSIDAYFKKNQKYSISGFVHHLNKDNIKVNFNLADTGHVSGISFNSGNYSFKGSALNKGYSWGNLSTQLNYNSQDDKNSLLLSNYLAKNDMSAKNFESSASYYKHLFKESGIKAESFNFSKSFAVLNKVNHDKLAPVFQKWEQKDYSTSPKEFLSKVANQLVQKEKDGFYSKITSINQKSPGFFTTETANKIFSDQLGNKITKEHLYKALDSIESNAVFIPKNMKKNMGISPEDYFKHKLDTLQSPAVKNKEFFQFEKLQKQRLLNNLLVFSKAEGLRFNESQKSMINGLSFNYNQLTKLDRANTEFEKGIFKENPISLIDKQFNLNKLDKFEFIHKTADDLNKNYQTSISDTDLKLLYAHVKKAGFDNQVPTILKSFSNEIQKKFIPASTNVVQYTEQKLNNKQTQIPSNSLFKFFNKIAKTAQQQGPKTRINKQEQEEEKEKGMQID